MDFQPNNRDIGKTKEKTGHNDFDGDMECIDRVDAIKKMQ